MRHLYVSNYGDVILPEAPPVSIKYNGWPDKRFTLGRWYQEYMEYIERLALDAYTRGGRLKKAPPFSAWLKHSREATI